MWLLVSFDLPSLTPAQRSAYRHFVKKNLENNGLIPLHESFYYRQCFSIEQEKTLRESIANQLPKEGKILLLTIPESVGNMALCIQDNEEKKYFIPKLPSIIL